VIEQKAFKIVHDAIYEVTGCTDLKSGDLYLSRVLVKAILALIAEEQKPLVDLLAEAQFEIAFDQKNGYPSYTVKETLSKIDTALKGGQQ
jgi:hypothetical protein